MVEKTADGIGNEEGLPAKKTLLRSLPIGAALTGIKKALHAPLARRAAPSLLGPIINYTRPDTHVGHAVRRRQVFWLSDHPIFCTFPLRLHTKQW